jgi:predicted glycosyltransferase
MRILIYLSHPAQYLFLRETINRLSSEGIKLKILIKTKDVLENLLLHDKQPFTNILGKQRDNSRLSIFISLLKRIYMVYYQTLKFKPSIMLGTDASIAIVGKMLHIHRITIIEDDYEAIKLLGMLTYPFTETILCPKVCKVGKWEYKKVGYDGYMKLGYLHPNIFKLKKECIKYYNLPSKYAIIRLSGLEAYHDKGINGINYNFLNQIILTLQNLECHIFISSETKINANYEKYLLEINPNDMQQVLANSTVLISDSQSMSVEASLLGIPSIRISSFVGRISVLEELEHRYQLTYGIDPKYPEKVIKKLKEILSNKNIKPIFSKRRHQMIKDKIDVSSFLVWFLKTYPKSTQTISKNPQYPSKFK